MRQGMLTKEAREKHGFAVWTRVPGTPFTLPGSPTIRERLPGMTGYAPREVITRMAEGLAKGEKTPMELAESEALRDRAGMTGLGGLAGFTGGSMLGRLLGGEAAVSPFLDIAKKGVTKQTLQGLAKIPTAMKILPFLGLGAGALIGQKHWEKGINPRREEALQVSKGLLAERVLQSNALSEALKTNAPYTGGLLRGLPIATASSPRPYIMRAGQIGV
jgi:hypothetical protein